MDERLKIAISWPDLAVILTYLIGIVGLGVWAWHKRRRQEASSAAYFLAGSSLRWPVIGLALFSANISTTHLVSLAQEGYVNGLAYGNFEWMAAFLLIILSLFFAPFYIRSRVATLPDFLEKRYSPGCRNWLAGLSIISAVFIHIGFSLYTGAVVLKGLFGIDINVSIAVTAVLTGIYTIIGGLLAVVLTESVQTIILIGGSACVVVIGLVAAGGWSGLAAAVEPVKLTVLRTAAETPSLPWYAVFLGYPVIGLWYWCADQTIVQRVLGAKDENHARIGPLFTGFLKILPVFLFVLPGVIALALIRQGKLPAIADSADTYSLLINKLLPVGLRGLVAAALLAALMSTVSAALNSIATLFTLDLYRKWKPRGGRAAPDARRPAGDVCGHGRGHPLVAAHQSLPEHLPGDRRPDLLHRAAHHGGLRLGRLLAAGLDGGGDGDPVGRVGARAGGLFSRLVQGQDRLARPVDDGDVLSVSYLLGAYGRHFDRQAPRPHGGEREARLDKPDPSAQGDGCPRPGRLPGAGGPTFCRYGSPLYRFRLTNSGDVIHNALNSRSNW